MKMTHLQAIEDSSTFDLTKGKKYKIHKQTFGRLAIRNDKNYLIFFANNGTPSSWQKFFTRIDAKKPKKIHRIPHLSSVKIPSDNASKIKKAEEIIHKYLTPVKSGSTSISSSVLSVTLKAWINDSTQFMNKVIQNKTESGQALTRDDVDNYNNFNELNKLVSQK